MQYNVMGYKASAKGKSRKYQPQIKYISALEKLSGFLFFLLCSITLFKKELRRGV